MAKPLRAKTFARPLDAKRRQGVAKAIALATASPCPFIRPTKLPIYKQVKKCIIILMFYQCFRLNYIMYLQKKYYKNFKNWDSDILILPPVFKRIGLNLLLCFPVAKRLEQDNISRPVGVITVNKQGKETVYNMQNYEFSFENQDFVHKYPYNIKAQEVIKVTLDKLYASLPLLAGKQKKQKIDEYEKRLKDLLSEEYFVFYEDLKHNQIVPVSDYIKRIRKIPSKNQGAKRDYSEKLKKELSKFIKKEILPNTKGYPSFAKLYFYQKLGEYIQKIDLMYDFNIEYETRKYDIVKIISKVFNSNSTSTLQEDFISKLLLMTLNALLLRTKKKKLNEIKEDLQNYKEIFEEEIEQVESADKKEILKQIFGDLEKDKAEQLPSTIFYAYLYVFN